MRYFVDTPIYSDQFMCARVSDSSVETRICGSDQWLSFSMTLGEIERLVNTGFLVELEEDPFKESDCPVDAG